MRVLIMDSTTSSIPPAPLTQAKLDAKLLAVANGDINDSTIIDALIQSGANPNAKSGSGQTALMLACRDGHLNMAKALISHLDVPAINAVNDLGHSALIMAAGYGSGYVLIVAALINAGADVHQRTNNICWSEENALERVTARGTDDSDDSDNVAFQLFSAMSPCERDFAPYTGRSLRERLLSPPNERIAEALIRYQASETELRQRVVNISAGLSAGQNAQNNLSNMTELLALIAEYAFSNCHVNGYARRVVMEATTPRPSVMFSIGQSLAPLRRRVSNLATDAVNRTVRHFIRAVSIPSVIPCPVPAIEDKSGEKGPSKKVRR
jgi:hypothetical protein